MEDIIYRSTIGTGGFFATLGLAEFNEVISAAVGIATLIYMGISIYKTTK